MANFEVVGGSSGLSTTKETTYKLGAPGAPTELEGYYACAKQIPSQFNESGFSTVHIFKTRKGLEGAYGTTDLNGKLESVAFGTMTRVKFLRMKPIKGKRPMYEYEVAQDRTNVNAECVYASNEEASVLEDSDAWIDPNADVPNDFEEQTTTSGPAQAAAKTRALLSKPSARK